LTYSQDYLQQGQELQLSLQQAFQALTLEEKIGVIVTVLLSVIFMTNMFRKFTNTLGLTTEDPPTSVIAQFGKSSYKIEFEFADFTSDQQENGMTVGFLRTKVSEIISHPLDTITLVFSGKKLTNDKAYLQDYGLKTDSKVLVISSKSKPRPKPKAKAPAPVVVKSPREKIQDVQTSMAGDLPGPITQFLEQTYSSLDVLSDDHHRLSELVLQKMFLLDDVETGEDQELRQFRKSVINELHNLHENIDRSFKDKKSLVVKQKKEIKEGEQKKS
jgi:hypothetical protein